ncbi:NAD(P)/FAD-dependent oxidoreductase [Pedobacter cryotolerans]|uniref:FAD-binding oxidoreductase n=1 Tax=Pedobacter cryotolerans TaxID=2571270 RepID=A0A4U1CAN1_9SPHI|nr:FAD-binding oxidoreductase [Pedobacter cryotolerans]TKC03086.1 FAD-binding oxidoreductase [Pedobacter cryotolerans]
MSFNLSYWEKKNFFSADVIVIGSGIVGLNAAITIKTKNPKISVIVLERGFLPAGASTKNAGFACFGSISELMEQEKLCGTDALHSLISKRWNGLLKLKNLLGDDNIAFENYGGYELFKNEESTLANDCVSKISHFNSLIEDIVNKKDTYYEASSKINSFGFSGVETLIECQLEAQIDPGKMMKALIAKCSELGVMVLNNCMVDAIFEENDGCSITTNQGKFIAKKVLLTTNAFVKGLVPNLAVSPGRGQVIVTSPIKNLKVKGTFHYDKGYYYFRNVDNRILLGGGRNLDFKAEETTEFGETELVQNSLYQLLKEVIIPETDFEIEHKWSGIMAFGPQLAPIIKEVKPNVFCAVRCNGMGIAIGSFIGEEAGEMVVESL